MSSKTGFPPEISDAILLRDGALCAMLGADGCAGRLATEANHRLNRGAGGVHGARAAIVNSPANGCATEHRCNWALEAVPEFAEEGRRRGVKLESGADPHEIPLWSVFYRQWVRLLPDGLHLTGIVDATLDAREWREWLGEVLT